MEHTQMKWSIKEIRRVAQQEIRKHEIAEHDKVDVLAEAAPDLLEIGNNVVESWEHRHHKLLDANIYALKQAIKKAKGG